MREEGEDREVGRKREGRIKGERGKGREREREGVL